MVLPIEGQQTVPSVEAVEMMSVCAAVPAHAQRNSQGQTVMVPNLRALLHGHVGVEYYNPERIESLTLAPPFYTYLVSCGTGALAHGTAEAFARSTALQSFDDARQIVFLEQPGHGVVVVEKWAADRAPFDLIEEALANGDLKVTSEVPQGPVEWIPAQLPDGRRVMRKKAAS